MNPAKGCLTCSYIHIYMQNKSRPNSRKKYWCKPPTPPVSWDRQSALGEERGLVGAYLPKWVPRTEIVQPTVPQKRQLTHALPQVRATSINCLQLQSSPLFTQYQSPRLCFYEHTQSPVTLYLLMEFFTCCAQNCQTVFANIFIQGSMRKKNMKTQSELGILFSLLWRVSK